MKFISIILFSFLSLINLAQEKSIIDTVIVANDTLVIFADKTWEYRNMINFSGILNSEINDYINQEYEGLLDQPWNNNEPYVSTNDLSKLNDTLWLCNVDKLHAESCIPNPGNISSRFGKRGSRYHKGIDISFNITDSIVSAFDGIVRYAKYNNGGYGNLVIIRHYNGLETFYAHLKRIDVSPNQKVFSGDYIGKGGSTGRASGPHLHFEVRFFGNALDPDLIFDFANNNLLSENLFISKNTFSYIKKYGASNSSSSKYHKIRSGDTLYGLALKYGTSLNKISKLNNIKADKILQIGEQIRVR